MTTHHIAFRVQWLHAIDRTAPRATAVGQAKISGNKQRLATIGATVPVLGWKARIALGNTPKQSVNTRDRLLANT